jgi:ParB family chromosome partitioning protein
VSVTPDDDDVAAAGGEPGSLPWGPMAPAMIGVDQLHPHPDNAREDLDLSQEFIASIAESGIRKPLQVTPDDGGGFLVIDGNRRLAGAVKAGQAEVPCYLDPAAAADKASQFLDMVVGNSAGYRRNFTPVEEATALFAAHEAGASRTRIRKATGRSAAQVKTALAVGGLSGEARAAAGEMTGQLDLEQLALLAEFDGDPRAVARITLALSMGNGAEHEAERIRQERAEAAEHGRLVAELEADGITVTDDLPNGALPLHSLLHDGQELTADAHASCPGRGAYFRSWSLMQPVYYCASPQKNGHTEPSYGPPASDGTEADAEPDAPVPGSSAVPDREPEPSRRLVIEGNKAWKAAGEVRHRWLAAQLFTRRSAPAGAARFVARQLLTMPEPLRAGLANAASMVSFPEITRQSAVSWLEITDTTAAARLPLLMLAPIVTAYEHALTDGEGRNTWRFDRYSLCPRRDAGTYLAFLGSIGYELSAIEQAVVDGVAYTGEPPAGPVLDLGTDPDTPSDDSDHCEALAEAPGSDHQLADPAPDAGGVGVGASGEPGDGATGQVGDVEASVSIHDDQTGDGQDQDSAAAA